MYIEVKDLKKSYGTGDSKVQVLRGVTTEVEQGKMCVIQGTSGSGKSTLLNCIGGLDTIDSGSVVVNGTQIAGMTQDGLAEYRRANLGFIFQFYNLVPNLTALAEKRPELLATATMPDGHIYGLPGISEMGYIDDDGTYIGIGAIPQFTSINKDWLEAVGMEMPTTLDELHDVLAVSYTHLTLPTIA